MLGSSTGIVILLPSPYYSAQPLDTAIASIINEEDDNKTSKNNRYPNRRLLIQEFTPWATQEYSISRTQRITLNLTQTSSQIHRETHNLFWKLNRIWSPDVSSWKLLQHIRFSPSPPQHPQHPELAARGYKEGSSHALPGLQPVS